MPQERLHKEIIALSESAEWDEARDEWDLSNIWMSDDPETCLCGHHPIKEICVIQNQHNGNRTEVGNCCVNNFLGIDSEILFASVRKVKIDCTQSFNEATIEMAKKQGFITEWEWKFYLNIWRKRKLSAKQAKTKLQVNEKILDKLRR